MKFTFSLLCVAVLGAGAVPRLAAQASNIGTIQGMVLDPSGKAVAGASVLVTDPAANYQHTVTTGPHGHYELLNVPFDPYEVIARAPKFATAVQSVNVKSAVPLTVDLKLALAGSNTTVSVEAASNMVATVSPSAHTVVSQRAITELPEPSPGAGLADLIAETSPSVVADSNGFFHPLGDHAEQTFVVDGQPDSNQQSKLFSTAIPTNAISSLNLVTAAPSAEYGDKTSLVVEATTRSGLGETKPHGEVETYYGSFGTVGENARLGWGNAKFGNFLAVDSVRSGRFMDSPEFVPLHDIGNNGTIFDRIDFQLNPANIFHLDLLGARNWFQIPNTYDQQATNQNQRQQVISFDIAPSYQHVFNASTLLTGDAWLRRDHVNYYPSGNPFADQPATMSQDRFLTVIGGKLDVTYASADNNLDAGIQATQTQLQEQFQLGLTNPLFNADCVNAGGAPVAAPGVTQPAGCAAAGFQSNPSFSAGLAPYDLTRGGSLFNFSGRHNINEISGYAQDSLTLGGWNFSLGLRDDHYAGLVTYNGIQPRVGFSRRIPWSHSVIRASYTRAYESPYNENLLLSSLTGQGGLATNVFGAYAAAPLQPGRRNLFDVGLNQELSKYVRLDGDYFWKYTNSAFDFDTMFNTPITFPITWAKSKIDGFGVRISTVTLHGVSVGTSMGHARARYFGPETGGLIFNSPLATGAFRIDHDQNFQQSTDVNYRHGNVWTVFTWQYESGLVAGAVPTLASVLALGGDQQAAMGFYCGSQVATLTQPITACTVPYGQWGATRVSIPAPGTENPDTNPPRIAPRNLFDFTVGDDDLYRTELGQFTANLSMTNLGNTEALYNFLSTFSGTHFVEPRSAVLTLGFSF